MSALISQEDMFQFENMIYLPMVISVLNKDRRLIDSTEFKLRGPYQEIVDQAIRCAEKDLKETKSYIREHKLKIVQGKRDDFATEYLFYHSGFEDARRYMNLRLRNRTEELLRGYLEISILSGNPSAQ